MKHLPGFVKLLLFFILCATAIGADLSLMVLESEEEIINAYENGEISYSQMILLMEIKEGGITPDNFHLLDDIPNLSFFIRENPALKTELYSEQLSSFIEQPLSKSSTKNYGGSIKYTFYQNIEDDPETRYHSNLKYNYNNRFSFDGRVRKDYSGAERITYRSFKYDANDGFINELIFGNFTKRFGLGTVIGHRGKLLGYSKQYNSESLLFPDYGGYNGVYTKTGNDNYIMQSLFSHNRDLDFSLSTYANMITRKHNKIQPSLIVGINRIKNRETGESYNDIKFALSSTYRYKNGYNTIEITSQNNQIKSLAAFITEGKHRFRQAEIKYAGWVYDDELIDLSIGSKYVYLPSEDTLDNVDFTYTGRRAGQKGMLFKTDIALDESMKLSSNILFASKNSDSLDVQHATILSKQISTNYHLSINHLSKFKKRVKNSATFETTKRQTTIELRYKNNNVYWRNSIGYSTETDKPDYVSLLTTFLLNLAGRDTFEIWLNIRKIDLNRKQLEYWNGFVRFENLLANNLKMAFKLSQTYNKYSDKRYNTVISFELNIIL